VGEAVEGVGGVFFRDDRAEKMEYGRFAWASDLEGNRFELWEPS
jgi:predicted enzyme related to lactoylglutathione lyase